MTQLQWRKIVLVTLLFLVSAHVERAAEPALTKAQIKQFMLTAKVTAFKHTKKGITDPWRLTLTDGTITHEAIFQPIDEHKSSFQYQDGHREINFVDSYKYNIAGYELAELTSNATGWG
jgi:hypothetical protein